MKRKNKILFFSLVLGFYFLLALLVTFPLLLGLKSSALGELESDVWKHIWGFWWIKDSLLEHQVFPLKTRLLNFPEGGSLFFIDALGAVFSLPLQALFGLIPAYNLMIIFNLASGGFAAFLLCRYLIKNNYAALLGGVVYAFSAYFYSHIISGVSEALNIPWLPLFLLYFIRSLKEKNRLNPVLAALFLALSALGSPYNGIYCAISGSFILLSHFLLAVKKQWQGGELKLRHWLEFAVHFLILLIFVKVISRPEGRLYFIITFLAYLLILYYLKAELVVKLLKAGVFKRLLLLGALAIILIAPPFYFFQQSLSAQDALVVRKRFKESFSFYLDNPYNACKISDYFAMGKDQAVVSQTVDRLTKVTYPGWLVMLLAFLALVKSRRRYQLTFLLLGLSSGLLSLGPYLRFSENTEKPFSNYFYFLFYKIFPFFSQVAIPYRFTLMVMLCLGVLAGFYLGEILRAKKGEFKIPLILILAILLESFLLSPVPFPLPRSKAVVSDFYRQLGSEKEFYGLIDFPIQRPDSSLLPGEYFYYQVYHKKGIPNNVEGTIPVYVYRNLLTIYLFNLEKSFDLKSEKVAYAPPRSEFLNAVKDLKTAGYRYIVLHLNYYPPELLPAIRCYMAYFFGQPRHYFPGLEVYQIAGKKG